MAGRAGRQGWQAWLAGRAGRQDWQAGLAGRAGRQGWQAGLSGRHGSTLGKLALTQTKQGYTETLWYTETISQKQSETERTCLGIPLQKRHSDFCCNFHAF